MKTIIKEQTIIGTREFLRQFSKIAKHPTSKKYIVVSHGKPLLTVTPYSDDEAWWENLKDQTTSENKKDKRLTLEQFRKKYSFRSGEKHLSQRIDEIVYGIKRS